MADNWWDNEEAEEETQPEETEEKENTKPTSGASVRDEDEEQDEDQSGGANQQKSQERKTKKDAPPTPAPALEKTEAQKIIEAKQRKHEEEEMEALRLMEEQRRLAREKEDEDLRRLKEKQAQRKREREEEERRMAEEKALLEEQRRKEEEARKQKIEDEKRKKQEEAERKKAAAAAAMSGGRNFVIEKEKEGQGESTIDKFMNISKAKTEMSLNTIELETLRQKTISDRVKPLSIADLDVAGLKATAEELWKTIVQLETSKYDLAERFKRQEYDLKELNERQRQINNKKHVASGAADPNAAASRYPPKVVLISKYERRTDRRTFGERKSLFEKDGKVEEQKELIKPKAIKAKADWVKNKDDVKKVRHDDDEETEKDPEGRDHDEVENVRPRKMSNAKEQEELPQKNQIEQETDETAADEPAAAAEEEGESLW